MKRRATGPALALLLVLAACVEAPLPGAAPGEPWFKDRAAERGLDFVHDTGYRERYLFPEIVCGGAALFDMDTDGDLDAYLVQAGGVLVPRAQRPGNRLYANDGAARFTDVSAGSGAEDRGFGMGAATGDTDGDGDLDLYVTNLDGNALLRNDGAGRFRDVSAAAGVTVDRWSSSAAFLDHDRDGDLDLWVVNYVLWSESIERTCYAPPHGETYCGPKAYDRPAPDTLLENQGGLAFRDVSQAFGLDPAPGNGLGITCLDADRDGWIDVFVANDASPNQLWLNQEGRRFVERAGVLGCAADQDGLVKAGMGVGVGDVDQDGDEDLLVVNMQEEPDSFFRNEGGRFVDRTAAAGFRALTRPFTRFGVAFHDFDHDGRLDLYEANGNILHSYKSSGPDPFAEANMLFRGLSGLRFEEVLPRGGTEPVLVHTSRGAAFGDVDQDGDVDLLVVNRDGPTYLLLNRAGAGGHWIGFRVLEASGRDALGAEVELAIGASVQRRTVRTAYSYCSANDPRVHFGLGAAVAIDRLSVRWPDGELESAGPLAANRYWILRRGQAPRPEVHAAAR